MEQKLSERASSKNLMRVTNKGPEKIGGRRQGFRCYLNGVRISTSEQEEKFKRRNGSGREQEKAREVEG